MFLLSFSYDFHFIQEGVKYFGDFCADIVSFPIYVYNILFQMIKTMDLQPLVSV